MERSKLIATSIAVVTGTAAAFYLYTRLTPAKAPTTGFKCKCGSVHGTISSTSALRLICYCDDCQRYATWLSSKNNIPSPVLDAHGGSDIVQVFKTDIEISTGKETLNVSQIEGTAETKDYKTMRVYASCCNTPLFNTTREFPIVGVFVDALDDKEVFGPVLLRIMAKFARGNVEGASQEFPFSFLVRAIYRNLLSGRANPQDVPVDLRNVNEVIPKDYPASL
ncbi:UNVERIFIED_CONTAM: hypothetical protein HDU68_006216 [Siphonaria sp. JEL0065]|nr:hypothetical protein HDU68_006216 [Siphonaria sp. JEL0065]